MCLILGQTWYPMFDGTLFDYGDNDLPNEINRNILRLTLHPIHESGRFD